MTGVVNVTVFGVTSRQPTRAPQWRPTLESRVVTLHTGGPTRNEFRIVAAQSGWDDKA